MLAELMNDVYREYAKPTEQCDCPHGRSHGDCVQCHKESYRYVDGYDREGYGCDNYVRIYMLRYMTAHVPMAQFPLESTMAIMGRLATADDVYMVSLGGAYGNETVALLDLAERWGFNAHISAVTVDRAGAWRPYHDWVVRRCADLAPNRNCEMRFLQADVTSKANETGADIVFVPWILSDTTANPHMQRILTNAMSIVADNGFIVFLDRTESAVYNQVDSVIACTGGLKIISADNCVCGRTDVRVPLHIRNNYCPKLNFQTCYRVLQKAC